MSAADPLLIRTRRCLHGVAELVLAGPQHRSSATIRLRVAPGGFRTWSTPGCAVVGTDVVAGGQAVPIDGRTPRQLADAVGLVAGAPRDVYGDGSGIDVDDELALDAAAVATIADAFSRGDAALRRLAPGVEPVLWPEHFDVGIRASDVNYGVSPGDDAIPEPYAYVGVDAVPAGDPFWNAPFGAARPMSTLPTVANVLAFFTSAAAHLTG